MGKQTATDFTVAPTVNGEPIGGGSAFGHALVEMSANHVMATGTFGQSTVAFDTLADESELGFTISGNNVTVPEDGWYEVNASIQFITAASIRLAGVIVVGASGLPFGEVNGNTTLAFMSGSRTAYLTAGQTIKVNVAQSTNGTLTVYKNTPSGSSGSYYEIKKIG